MDTVLLKHTLRNILIWKASFLGVSWLYRQYVRRTGPLVRVVVFHDVPDEEWFSSMIQTLTTQFHVITPHEFNSRSFSHTDINVLITFDDGYASWEHVALPVLRKYSLRALFFVNSGLVDIAQRRTLADTFMKEQLRITPRAPLCWSGVRALLQEGHTIGGHTRTHADLTTLTEAELTKELIFDKQVLESKLGISVVDFAYPFGTRRHINEVVRHAVEDAGYTRGYTAVSHFVSSGEMLHIPRMCIESDLSTRMCIRWVRGAYDLFDMLKELCVR